MTAPTDKGCCPPSSHPYLSPPPSYIPKGTIQSLGDLPIYVTKPSSTTNKQKGVIVCPEVFGWAGHLKSITDAIAERGYTAVLIDSHRGDTAIELERRDIPEWVAKIKWEDVVGRDFEVVMKYLREECNCTAIGSIGFCWGGKSKALVLGFATQRASGGNKCSVLQTVDSAPKLFCKRCARKRRLFANTHTHAQNSSAAKPGRYVVRDQRGWD